MAYSYYPELTQNDRIPASRVMENGFHQAPTIPRSAPAAPTCSRCGDRRELEIDGFRPTDNGGEERVISVGSCPDCVTVPRPTVTYPYRYGFDLTEARRKKVQF